MAPPQPPWRRIVVEELQLLASEEAQLEYERNVPHVDITAELVSGWFDDTYHPADSGFRTSFSDAELDALERFNGIYLEKKRTLPQSNGTVRSWLGNESWREVMRAASTALANVAA